jgi:Protein of unknown function (DUF664)
MSDEKPPRFDSSESETLVAFLDYLRESVIRKLDGVSETDARRSLVQSGTSLLFLVSHLTVAEVSWFQLRFAGNTKTVPTESLDEASPVADHVAQYRIAIRRDNVVVGEAGSLEERCAADDYRDLTLRWVLVHMIEETARHAGHADIIREQIDGATGR